jgi:hypothetical protein
MKILQNRTNLTTKAANVFIMRYHMHNIQNIKSLENNSRMLYVFEMTTTQ